MSKNEKIILNQLLDSYSLIEISSIFTSIDEQILALNENSSKDFIHLNDSFKRFYKDIKVVLDGITNTLDENHNKNYVHFFEQLSNFHQLIAKGLDQILDTSGQILVAYDQVISNVDLIEHPLQNYKQILMTLRLLGTNLNLDQNISQQFSEETHKRHSEMLCSFLQGIPEHFANTDDKIKGLAKLLNIQKEALKKIIEVEFKSVKEEIDFFGRTIGSLKKSISSASWDNKSSANRTKAIVGNIEKIITHLQYEDIIYQRIQHIQETHKDILIRLEDIKKNEKERVTIHDKVKSFLQIRDIAGLQAAQLIHVNKEYQHAIEMITQMFIELGHHMQEVSEIFQQYSTLISKITTDKTSDTLRSFNKGERIVNVFVRFQSILKESLDDFNSIIQDFINNIGALQSIEDAIKKHIDPFLSKDYLQSNKSLMQIVNLYKDLNRLTIKIEKTAEKIIKELPEKLKKLPFPSIDEKTTQIQKQAKETKKTTEEIYRKTLTLHENVGRNVNLSKIISGEIKNSLAKIHYYEYFEEVISQIITQLNVVNFKLHSPDEKSDLNIKDNLEHIKSRYTVKSEFDVHKKVTESNLKDISDLFTVLDEDNRQQINEDDDIEFF